MAQQFWLGPQDGPGGINLLDRGRVTVLRRGFSAPVPAEGIKERVVTIDLRLSGTVVGGWTTVREEIACELGRINPDRATRRRTQDVLVLSVTLDGETWSFFDVLRGSIDVTELLPRGKDAFATLTLVCLPLVRGDAVQAQNLLLAPTDPTALTWTKTNVTATAGDATAPDGSATAGTLLETTTNAGHTINQSIIKAASAVTYTLSTYVKASGRSVVHLSMVSGANGATAGYDIANGVVSTPAAMIGSGWSSISAAIEDAGEGWWRISLTATSDTATTLDSFLALSDGSNTVYAGNTGLGIRVWGAQLEEGASAGLLLVPTHNPDTIIPEHVIPGYEEPETPATGMDADPDNLIGSATWTVNNMNTTTGQSDPTGGTGATRSIENTGTSLHFTQSASFTAASAGTYTAACYVKKGPNGPSTIYLQASISNNRGYAIPFNLDTGTFGTPIAASTLTGYTSPTGSCVNVGNGWWFVKWTGQLPADTGHELRIHTTTNIESTYTGDGLRGVYVFRPQAVIGSTIDTPTAYIPASSVPDETVPEELIASGKQNGVWIYGVPGDAPALCRVELEDASSGVAINRVHLGAWSGKDVLLGEVTPLLTLVAGPEAAAVSDGSLYVGDAYANLGADGTWSIAGQATVDALGPQRGMVDVWARVRDHSSNLSPPASLHVEVTGGIYVRRLAREDETRDTTVQSITIPKPNNNPGDTLVLVVEYAATNPLTTPSASVTATGGETWTAFAPIASGIVYLRQWYVEDAAALTGDITVSFSADVREVTITLVEVVGAAAASFDGAVTDMVHPRTDGASLSITVGPITTTQAHSLLLSWAVGTRYLSQPLASPGDWEAWHLVSSLSSGSMAFHTYSALVTESITWTRVAHLGPGGQIIPPEPEGWIGVIAAFKAASATAANITRADWSVAVTALDADGNESLPTGSIVVSVPSESSAVAVSWPAVAGATSYRIYRNRGSGWGYATVSAPTTSYLFTSESGLTTADPPTSAPPVAAFRAAVALPSGTTLWRSQSSVPSKQANATWEDLNLGRMPWPPIAEGEGTMPDGAFIAVEASHLTGSPVDVNAVWLVDVSTGQVIAWREGLNADTPAGWVIDTNRDGMTSGWLRDAATGDDVGQLALVPGRLAVNPGNAQLVMRTEVAGGESNLVDADPRITRVLVTPRFNYLRGRRS